MITSFSPYRKVRRGDGYVFLPVLPFFLIELLGWEEVLQNLGRQSDVLARTTALEAVHSIFPSAGKGQSSMAIRRSSRHILPPNSNNIFRNTISSPSLWWSSLEALLPPGHIPLELQDEARMELASLLSHYPSTPSPTLKQQILLLRVSTLLSLSIVSSPESPSSSL